MENEDVPLSLISHLRNSVPQNGLLSCTGQGCYLSHESTFPLMHRDDSNVQLHPVLGLKALKQCHGGVH